MKINRSLALITTALVLILSLAACSKGPVSVTPDTSQDTQQKPDTDITEPSEPGLGVDADEEEPEIVPESETDFDPIDDMIDSSDYIAKIKLIQKGEDKTQLKVLDTIKGNISASDLPVIDNLELNRAYLVFLKKVDSTVVLTDEFNGVILLEGDNHELFEKINKKIHKN